jgi:hypothetical protein
VLSFFIHSELDSTAGHKVVKVVVVLALLSASKISAVLPVGILNGFAGKISYLFRIEVLLTTPCSNHYQISLSFLPFVEDLLNPNVEKRVPDFLVDKSNAAREQVAALPQAHLLNIDLEREIEATESRLKRLREAELSIERHRKTKC